MWSKSLAVLDFLGGVAAEAAAAAADGDLVRELAELGSGLRTGAAAFEVAGGGLEWGLGVRVGLEADGGE